MSALIQSIRPTIALLALNTMLLGFAYPAISTLLLQGGFSQQANGSLIAKDDLVLGSELIGQQFTNSNYFWGRPSATGPYAYNASSSSGSNLGAANPVLLDNVQARIKALGNGKDIPVDLVTASGSGLDPHISPAAAEYQIARVAKARGMKPEALQELVTRYTEGRQFGFLGESRVNVLKLNLALDGKL
jgi:K+-transporting ATPase ATPase C chain